MSRLLLALCLLASGCNFEAKTLNPNQVIECQSATETFFYNTNDATVTRGFGGVIAVQLRDSNGWMRTLTTDAASQWKCRYVK